MIAGYYRSSNLTTQQPHKAPVTSFMGEQLVQGCYAATGVGFEPATQDIELTTVPPQPNHGFEVLLIGSVLSLIEIKGST